MCDFRSRTNAWAATLLAAAGVCSGSVHPAEAAPAGSPEPGAALQDVVVTGEQPGPGLWQVSKNDHVL